MSEYPEMLTPAEWRRKRDQAEQARWRRVERINRRRAAKAANPRNSIITLQRRLEGQTFTATTAGYVEQSDKQGTGVPPDQL